MSRKISNTLSLLRSILVLTPLVWLYTIFMGTLSLLSSFFDRDGTIQHWFARTWSRMILATTMTPVAVVGMEKIDTSKPAVYASNHSSALDIPALYANLPFQFRILAKKELFRYPFMGWHLTRSGQIPIHFDPVGQAPQPDNSVSDNADSKPRSGARNTLPALKRAVHTLKAGMPLLIFPEGGRSPDGHLQPFLGGAFWAAIRAGVDVVPIVLVGPYERLKMNSFHIHPGPITLIVGDPISTRDYTLRDMEKLTSRVRDVMSGIYYSHAAIPPPSAVVSRQLADTD